MTVYFFGRALDGAVKIGFTDRDPLVRMGEVARSCGYELELLAVEPDGDRATEREWHEACAESRISGEWFRRESVVDWLIEDINWRQSDAGQAIMRRSARVRKLAALLRESFPPLPLDPNGDLDPFEDWAAVLAKTLVGAAYEQYPAGEL